MSKTLVLICASEGTTDSVFVACGDSEDLKRQILGGTEKRLARYEIGPRRDADTKWEAEHNEALFAMLDRHEQWENGRYVLDNIEPHWQQWALIVCDGEYSDDVDW